MLRASATIFLLPSLQSIAAKDQAAWRTTVGDANDDIAKTRIKASNALRRPEVIRDARGAVVQVVRQGNFETGRHATPYRGRHGTIELPESRLRTSSQVK